MMGWDEIVSEKEVREESSAQIRAEQSIEEKRREWRCLILTVR